MRDTQTTSLPESTTHATVSDEDLFLHFQAHQNRDDFEELVHRFQGFVYRSAVCICKNNALAEEVTQNVFLRMTLSQMNFRDMGPGSFKGWLFRLVSNTAKDTTRSERRLTMREEVKRKQLKSTLQTEKPEHQQEQQELLTALHTAMFQLSEGMRTMIVMHYLQGLSQLEIGRMLGINQSHVSRQIEEGLSKIKKRLKGSGMALPAVGIPAMLSESQWADIPQSLSDKLAQLGEDINETIITSSNTSAAYKVTKTAFWWWISGAALLVAAVSTWAVMHTNPSATSTPVIPPASIQSAMAVKTPVMHFDFSDPQAAKGFTAIQGSWRWVPDGGGHMESSNNKSLLQFPELIQENCLEITVVARPILKIPNPEGPFIGVSWSEKIGSAAIFHNIGRPGGVAGPWETHKTYLNHQGMDFWNGSQHMSYIAHPTQGPRPLLLCIRGQYEVARIDIRKLEPHEVPDVSTYLDAIKRIPPDKRVGIVPVPELPSAVKNQPVTIEFHDNL